jgi:DNA-directed RNA polymerase subunit RPC12/RpoP
MFNAFAEQWKDLRRREWVVVVLFAGYIPSVAGAAWFISSITTTDSDGPMIAIAIAWMLAIAVAMLRVTYFPCPRCGKHFYMAAFFVTGRKCPHCGLRRYVKT